MYNVFPQVTVTLTVAIDGMTVKAKICKLSPTIKVTDSAVGVISGPVLTLVFNLAAKLFIVPKLNQVGQAGFLLPMIQHIRLINSKLSYNTHALCLTTDVQYSDL